MTEMFREAWPPMSVPDLAPDDDDPAQFFKVFQNNSAPRLLVLSFPFAILKAKDV